MDKLYPIVQRVRRPLLPDDEPQTRRDAWVASTTSDVPREKEVSNATPNTTGETVLLPAPKE